MDRRCALNNTPRGGSAQHSAAFVSRRYCAQLHSLGWPLSPGAVGVDAAASPAVPSPRTGSVSHSSSMVHLRDLNRRVLEHDLELRSSLLTGATPQATPAGTHPIASRAAAAAAWANSSADVSSPTRLSPSPATLHGFAAASSYSASPLLGASFASTPPTRLVRSAGMLSSSSAVSSTAPTQLSSVPERSAMPSPYRNLHVRTATAGGGEGQVIATTTTERSPPQSPEAPLSARALSARRAAAKARSASSERKAWQKAAGVWK